MKTFAAWIKEDGAVPVNNAGGGQIAGIGVGPQGEPGFSRKKTKMMSRKKLDFFNLLRKQEQQNA